MRHYQTSTLASGLRIILAEEPQATVSYLGLGVRVGSRDESLRFHGLSHSIEHMLFKGTRLRSAPQLIERMEAVGAELNAFTTKEETMLYAVCPSVYARRSLSVLLDIARHSRFPEEEWAKEQEVILDEIHSYEDSPSELISDEFEDQVFRPHPLGHAILGTEASVGRITTAHQRRFYQRHYRPERMVLFAQGAVSMELLEEYASRAFPEEAKEGEGKNEGTGSSPSYRTEARHVVRRRGTAQSHVLMGCPAFDLYDKRRLGLSLLANILGGNGMNARLNMELREKRGLVYHVECSYTPYTDSGLFSIYFGSSHRAEAEAMELVYRELERLAKEPLTETELTAALRQTRGQLLVASDNKEQHFLTMGKSFLHTGRFDTDEELSERLSTLTPEGLYETARELFQRANFHTLIYR
ncbi:pitrilysin family protein [Porphyromonas sp. oral taxon 278]|uniref:M16 family metallopeptidase n=1 Tax=Porphyromonas sp. oral taxon 278 TaxID=712437 RepID=UPI0025D498C1|nr:pitrilysin family protein [Porphyromonas sp. oral taxon 278]